MPRPPDLMPRVPDLLRERAASAPQGVALAGDAGPPLTFGDWQRRAARLAGGLAARGVRPGDRVALLFAGTHWTDYAVAYFGVLWTGAVAVPLSPRLAGAEVAAAARAAGCAGLVTGGDTLVSGLDGWRAGCAELEREPVPAHAGPAPELAEILHSSGTTGAPKLVAASHENLLAGWRPGASAPHDPAQFAVHAMPIATNAGQVALLAPLREPHSSVVMARFDARHYCELVTSHQASHTVLVPAMARWLVEHLPVDGTTVELRSVRTVVLTSAATAPELLARVAAVFPAATVTNIYTTTEAWPAMTAMDYDPGRPGSVGRPEAGQQLRVLSAAGEPCPAGETGEIALRTDGVAPRAYLSGDGDATFDQGWVRTADLGYLDADGYLHLVGRRAELINTGGFLVAPAEVEAALEQHPAVAEAGVAGLPHPVLGEVVAAAVVARSPVSAAGLGEWLAGRLAAHKRPARIVLVDRLPRNALEKVARPRLRQLLAAAPGAGPASGPRTPDERILLRLWCEVLGRTDIGVADDFLAVGGHSLAAFEIAARAGEALGVDLPRELILATPTVAGQAEAVARLRAAGAGAAPSPASVPIRRRDRARREPRA